MLSNKKGFGAPGIGIIFVLVLVVIALAIVQNGVPAEQAKQSFDKLNWSNYYENISVSIDNAFDDSEWMKPLGGIINKAVDFFGYSVIEVGKMAVYFAIENPNSISANTLLILVVLALIAPLIYPAFIVTVSLILIIREAWMNRKDRKRLRQLESGNKE